MELLILFSSINKTLEISSYYVIEDSSPRVFCFPYILWSEALIAFALGYLFRNICPFETEGRFIDCPVSWTLCVPLDQKPIVKHWDEALGSFPLKQPIAYTGVSCPYGINLWILGVRSQCKKTIILKLLLVLWMINSFSFILDVGSLCLLPAFINL
jgi:hypothetical protein